MPIVIVCLIAMGVFGAGLDAGASATGRSTPATSPVAAAGNSFCYPALRFVSPSSVRVESALGLNDNRPLPSKMSPGIEAAVRALATSARALSNKAPTAHMKHELSLLSAELRESSRPIDVVRAEAAFGATGYPELSLMCHTVGMIMTPTNPLGGFNPE